MAAECSNTSEGFPPFVDVGVYLGQEATLYPGGNTIPAAHLAQGMAAAASVERLDSSGNPSVTGVIGLLTLGMSNTNQETDYWEDNGFLENALQEVALVNGGVGGIGASAMDESYFVTVDGRVTTAGLTNAQIQWIWLKTAEPDEAGAFPTHAQAMQAAVKSALEIAVVRYPNLKGVSFSSRVYGGYGDLAASPSLEPWAYEGGFAFKWLIEAQIEESDPDLDYSIWPWMGWGPYLWADGETPRDFDGLFYICADFQADGAHPDTGAKVKVDELLTEYFTQSDETSSWFYGAIHPISTGTMADTTDLTQYTMSLSGLLDNTLHIILVFSRGAGVTPNAPTLSGNGVTWVQIDTRLFNTESTLRGRITAFRGLVESPTDGTLTIDFAGQTQQLCIASAMQMIGADTSGTNGSGAIVQSAVNSADAQSSITATLNPASHENSLVVAGFAAAATNNMSPSASWTIVSSNSSTTGRLMVAYETYFDETATATMASGTPDMAALAIEIIPAAEPEPEPEPAGPGIIVVGRGGSWL